MGLQTMAMAKRNTKRLAVEAFVHVCNLIPERSLCWHEVGDHVPSCDRLGMNVRDAELTGGSAWRSSMDKVDRFNHRRPHRPRPGSRPQVRVAG